MCVYTDLGGSKSEDPKTKQSCTPLGTSLTSGRYSAADDSTLIERRYTKTASVYIG